MKKVLIDIFLIFLLSLTPLLWFKPGEMMVGHDNIFPLDPQSFLEGRLYTWNQNKAFGQNQSLIMGSIPIHFIDALPSLLGFSLQTTQKLVYIFWFFLIGLSAYIFASLINPKSRFFKLFVAVFYQFNFFVLQGWWIGERTKFSAYIALPLVLSVFLLVYQQKISILKAAILNSLILFFFNAGGLFGIPLYGGLFVSVGLFVVFFSLTSFFQKEYQLIKNLVWTATLTVVGFLLVNSYYLVPALSQFFGQYGLRLGGIGGISGVLAWAQEISVGASFTNLFRLQGIAEWYDNPQHPYAKYFLTNPILISISFIWPLLIFTSLILVRKKREAKYILYFFLVYLVGIFFAAGTHPPLGFIYGILVRFIPGFAIFRTPYYKFAPALFISSAFLCAYTLDYLREKIGKHKILTVIFSCFWIFLILGYHFPYFAGNFFNWRENFSTRLKIPQYVFDFGNWLEKDKKDDYRVLFLPPNNPAWQYDIYKWGYLSLEPLGWLLNKQPLVYINSQNLNKEEQPLLELTYRSLVNGEKELFERLAFLLRIKYLVVRKDFYYDLEWAKTENPDVYQKAIKKFGYLKKKDFGDWELYETSTNPTASLFSFSKPELLSIPPEYIAEDYFRLSPREENQFLLVNQANLPLSEWNLTNYIIPQCLNCPHKESLEVYVPERKIIPGSLLYPLVLFSEERELRGKNPDEVIYDYVGLSLKRIGEIGGLVQQFKPIKSEYLDPYIEILQKIDEKFAQINDFEKKFQAAEKLSYYLDAEQEYLYNLFIVERNYGRTEKEVDKMRKIFLMINSLKDKIIPFLFEDGQVSSRIYSFNVNTPRVFEILLNLKDVRGGLGNNPQIEIKLDGESRKKIELKSEDLEKDYLSLGQIEIAKGKHQLLLTIAPLQNLTEEFLPSEKSFWGKPTKCFISQISRFNNQKVFSSDLSYKNDFSDALLMIIHKTNENGKDEEKLFKFDNSQDIQEFRRLIISTPDTKSASVEFCSPELTKEILDEKINLQVKEAIHPLLILTSMQEQPEVHPIVFSKINPTKYELEIKNANQPFFLAFSERFDPGWEISHFEKNHFSLGGYANGWWIDKLGSYKLILEYKPQKLLYKGAVISGLVILGGMLYLLKTWKKRI